MKRLLIAIIFILSGYHNECPAQWIKSYGIKVALTSAHDGYENKIYPETTKRRVGINIGGFIEWLNDPILSINTQVEYTQKGSGWDVNRRDEYNNDLGIVTYYRRLDYISIPVMVKFKIQTPIVNPFIMAGPRLDIFIGEQSPDEGFFYLYNKFKKNVKGASIGIGVQTTNPRTNVVVEIRYNLDFEDSYSNRNVKFQNNSYDLWIGLSF